MKIAVIGGKLQGIEASYLASKAGWDVFLIDKQADVPASGIADRFYQLDVTRSDGELKRVLAMVDLVIPATEDVTVLDCLSQACRSADVPFAYDPSAFDISSSKKKSNTLFQHLGFPVPEQWPRCSLPVFIKPCISSGSRNVHKLENYTDDVYREIRGFVADDFIVQEYLEGPSYSIEVFGCNGKYFSVQCTEIEVDHTYDCCRVLAPAQLPDHLERRLRLMSETTARVLSLQGIMDLEVIVHDSQLKILEIDARLPSQTPSAVFHSTGVNFLVVLSDIFRNGEMPKTLRVANKKHVLYEHIKLSSGALEIVGEHALAHAGPLEIKEGFFGADEAMTDFSPGNSTWNATLILTGNSVSEVWEKHHTTLTEIASRHGVGLSEGNLFHRFPCVQ